MIPFRRLMTAIVIRMPSIGQAMRQPIVPGLVQARQNGRVAIALAAVAFRLCKRLVDDGGEVHERLVERVDSRRRSLDHLSDRQTSVVR